MYAITINGDVQFVTDDWHELMQEYRKRRKATDKPVLLTEIDSEGEVITCS